MPAHRLKKIDIDDITLLGYSVAGEETVIASPQLDVCFDIGKAPEQVVPINNLFISHGHIDHTAGIAYYLSHRQFLGISPATVYMPEHLVAPMREMLNTWTRIDGNKIPANIIPVQPGKEFRIKPNLFVRAFETKHCFGSVGYTVIETRTKLKPEYRGLTSNQLIELKKQGNTIDAPVEIPLVTYFGDTQFYDYLKYDYIANSKILIIECTFFDHDHDGKAKAGKHMHINHLAEMLENNNNQHVILIHFSQRSSIGYVKKLLRTKLPPETEKKITILMDRMQKKGPQND